LLLFCVETGVLYNSLQKVAIPALQPDRLQTAWLDNE
jgi:hypothetical protein